MPILALSALTGKNPTIQGRGIALSLTLLVVAALVATGRTAFKGGSVEGMALTMTGIGIAGVDSVAALALLIIWGAKKQKSPQEIALLREVRLLKKTDKWLSNNVASARAQVIINIERKLAQEAVDSNKHEPNQTFFEEARKIEGQYCNEFFAEINGSYDHTLRLMNKLGTDKLQCRVYEKAFHPDNSLFEMEKFKEIIRSELQSYILNVKL